MRRTDGRNHAFPTTVYYNESPIGQDEGLTKREYVATRAMQGILANSERDFPADTLGHEAVAFADALINALNEEQP